jgi:hypothetical protein
MPTPEGARGSDAQIQSFAKNSGAVRRALESRRRQGIACCFEKMMEGGVFTYPIPRHGKDVPQPYIRGLRKKFKLTSDNGVSDEEFYR